MANSAGIVSPAYTILRCKKLHSSVFYEAYFHTDEFINHVLSKSVEGIRDGRQISYEAFKWLELPYCPVSEQEKIACLFFILNQRIEKQRQIVESLKKYKRGVLCKVFDEISDSALKVTNLGDLCHSISSGKTTSLSEFGKYPLFGSTGQIGYTDSVEFDEELILVARVGANAGVVNFHVGPCGVTDNTLAVRVNKEKCKPKYVLSFLEYYDPHRLIFGSGQPLVTGGQLKKIEVPIVAMDKQKYIIDLLSLINKRCTQEQEILNAFVNEKTGLLQQLFI